MLAKLEDGRQVRGARKQATIQHECAAKQLGILRDQTREASVMLELQAVNPSGHACPNLPNLLAANWKRMAVPKTVPGASKRREVVVTDLLLDFADVGSLHEVLKKRRAKVETLGHAEPVLAPKHQWAFSDGIGNALTHMHAAGWLHNDVKLQNVLLFATGRLVLGDLGLAERTGAPVGRVRGTPGYMAPELAHAYAEGKEVTLTPKMDVFALGVVMLFMAMPPGALKETGLSEADLMEVTAAGLLPDILLAGRLECDPGFRQIIYKATRPRPGDRASLKHICNLIKAGLRRSEQAGAAAETGAVQAQAAPGAPPQICEAVANGHRNRRSGAAKRRAQRSRKARRAADADGTGQPATAAPPPPEPPRPEVPVLKCILAAVLPGRNDDRGQCATPHGSHSDTPDGALAATPEHITNEHALLGNGGSLRTSCGGSPRPLPVAQSPVRSPARRGPPTYAEVTMGLGTKIAQPAPATYAQVVMHVGTKFAQRGQ